MSVCRTISDFYRHEYPFATAKLRHYHRQLSLGPSFHPFAIYNVDPGTFDSYIEHSKFEKFINAGRIVAGSWDMTAEPLASFSKFSVICRYFEGDLNENSFTYGFLRNHGYPDDEAKLYSGYGYASFLDELYKSISEDGVQICPVSSHGSPTARYDHVTVDIARDGELLFDENGCHRLAIARVLGCDRIPVRVNAIHREWYTNYGAPHSHPELTYRTSIPLRLRDLYLLDTDPSG